MNKKGFTLVEILAVLVILSLLLILTIPSIRDALTNGKNKINDINKKQIEDAAKIIVDEVIYCNMTEIAKKTLGDETSCSIAKTKLINGVNIDVSKLDLDDKSSKCSGTINVKIDSETYKEKIDTTNVICK